MRLSQRHPPLAIVLLLACAAPATVRNAGDAGPGPADKPTGPAAPARPAAPAKPAAPASPPTPANPCEYWGTYEFFYFAERETVPACLEAGEDPHARVDELGRTPLHNAARAWKESFIRDLLGVGVDIDARDWLGRTPLHDAADRVRPVEPDATDVVFLVPFSVHGGPAVAALLEGGADVGARDVRGNTPLHLTWRDLRPDHPPVDDSFLDTGAAPQLLAAGADPSARNDRGRPAGPGGCRNWHLQSFARAAVPPSAHYRFYGYRPLSDPISETYAKCVTAGADVTARDMGGHTVLHHAAGFADTSTIALLLEAGADVGARNHDGTTPLHVAARTGNADIATRLLERGADVNVADDGGTTPLLVAARNGNLAIVNGLLDLGADVNVLDDHGTALHVPRSGKDRFAIVDALLEAGMDLNLVRKESYGVGAERVEPVAETVESPEEPATQRAPVEPARVGGLSALLCDLSAGDYTNFGSPFKFPLESVAGCLGAGTSLETPERNGQPPIVWLPAGNIEVLELLLEAGAEVGITDGAGFTPLHWVGSFWHGGTDYSIAAARALLEAGADADARGPGGRSPLHMAAAARQYSHDAGSTEMETLLVQAGADVNARTDSGETPLHLALNSPAVASRLLELGADREARDDSGRVADPVSCENFGVASYFALADGELAAQCIGTVIRGGGDPLRGSTLHMAAGHARDPGVIHALMQAGAPLGGRDGHGYTPLHRAAETGKPAVIRALLEAGADAKLRVEVFEALNSWDPKDWTPLHLAARNRDAGAVALILDAGGDVHARVEGYETPLHIAATNENPEVGSLLLRAGADVNAREMQGKTPLHVAAFENPNPAVAAVLIEAGADLEARAMPRHGPRLRGLTPMYLAALGNWNPEVVTMLAEAGANVDAERAELRPDYPFMYSVSRSGLRTFGDLGHNSPLHLAALFNRTPGVLEALVRAGADLELRNRSGQTALHIAALHNPLSFPALLALGADRSVVDDEGKTPMDYARLNRTLHGLAEVRRMLVGDYRRPGTPLGERNARWR